MGRTETIGVRKGVQVRRTKGLRLGLGKLGDSVQRSGASDDGRERTKMLPATIEKRGEKLPATMRVCEEGCEVRRRCSAKGGRGVCVEAE